MKQLYSMLIALSAYLTSFAQIPIPGAPLPGSSTSCTTNPNIDVCPPTSNIVVGTHKNGVYHRGGSNSLAVNAVWRYRNMASVAGTTINVEVSVDAIYQATLSSIDDDAAVDQAGVSITNFFAPRISPDVNLNGTDRRGYVQFTMRFFKNSKNFNEGNDRDFATPVELYNLNYVHYDIDGSNAGNVNPNGSAAGSWFRETGAAKKVSPGNPFVLANAVTELSPYNYAHASSDWTGFAGSIFERDGVSRCAQVASSFSYSNKQASITVRMGYDYNAGNNMGRPVRQYGSRLGCFNFPTLSTLPVNLLNFSAIFNNQQTMLKWSADQEAGFEKYIVERSSTSSDFQPIGEKRYAGTAGRNNYEFTDDLSAVNGSTFYYRLKMLDLDGKFTYSSIVMVKKEAKKINGIALNPNPIISGATTIRFTADQPTTVDIKVVDVSGKVLLQQKTKANDGNNSIPINNLDKLKPGLYLLQLINEGESSVIKFSVAR
jgi:hypothetical protein